MVPFGVDVTGDTAQFHGDHGEVSEEALVWVVFRGQHMEEGVDVDDGHETTRVDLVDPGLSDSRQHDEEMPSLFTSFTQEIARTLRGLHRQFLRIPAHGLTAVPGTEQSATTAVVFVGLREDHTPIVDGKEDIQFGWGSSVNGGDFLGDMKERVFFGTGFVRIGVEVDVA